MGGQPRKTSTSSTVTWSIGAWRGTEILILMFAHQLCDPSCVHVNRGNHEDANMNERDRSIGGGFAQECRGKYGNDVYQTIQKTFNLMPLGTVVSNKLLIIHGGLFRCPGVTLKHINRVNRLRACPEHPSSVGEWIFFDSLWADPNPTKTKGISKRGDDCFSFGSETTKRFLKENGLHMVVRSHELPANSRGFQVHHDSKLITIFSASNYCGTSGNYGAVMLLQPSLEFEIFEHWAPELSEILDLEQENTLACQAVMHTLEDLTRREESYRRGIRRKSTFQLESEIVTKLKVKICERREQLAKWYEGQQEGVRLDRMTSSPGQQEGSTEQEDKVQNASAKPNKSLSLDTFVEGLSSVIGENVPWRDMINLHLLPGCTTSTITTSTSPSSSTAGSTTHQTTTTTSVDWSAFLQRFRVELDGINNVTWKRDMLATVFNAVLRAELPLRQLFALFDPNLSGAVSEKSFSNVTQSLSPIGASVSRSDLSALFALISKWEDFGFIQEVADEQKILVTSTTTTSGCGSSSTITKSGTGSSSSQGRAEGEDNGGAEGAGGVSPASKNTATASNTSTNASASKTTKSTPWPDCSVMLFLGNFENIYRQLLPAPPSASTPPAASSSSSTTPGVSNGTPLFRAFITAAREWFTQHVQQNTPAPSGNTPSGCAKKDALRSLLLQTYEQSDVDGDGLLSSREFATLLETAGFSFASACASISSGALSTCAASSTSTSTGSICTSSSSSATTSSSTSSSCSVGGSTSRDFASIRKESAKQLLREINAKATTCGGLLGGTTGSGTTTTAGRNPCSSDSTISAATSKLPFCALLHVLGPILDDVCKNCGGDAGGSCTPSPPSSTSSSKNRSSSSCTLEALQQSILRGDTRTDEIVMLIYNSRRSLRRALQHFDPESSYLVRKKHLRYALQGLAVALSKASGGSSSSCGPSSASGSTSDTSCTSSQQEPPPLNMDEITHFVRKLPEHEEDESEPINKENNRSTVADLEEDNDGEKWINYNTCLDSFVVVDMQPMMSAGGRAWRKRCSTLMNPGSSPTSTAASASSSSSSSTASISFGRQHVGGYGVGGSGGTILGRGSHLLPRPNSSSRRAGIHLQQGQGGSTTSATTIVRGSGENVGSNLNTSNPNLSSTNIITSDPQQQNITSNNPPASKTNSEHQEFHAATSASSSTSSSSTSNKPNLLEVANATSSSTTSTSSSTSATTSSTGAPIPAPNQSQLYLRNPSKSKAPHPSRSNSVSRNSGPEAEAPSANNSSRTLVFHAAARKSVSEVLSATASVDEDAPSCVRRNNTSETAMPPVRTSSQSLFSSTPPKKQRQSRLQGDDEAQYLLENKNTFLDVDVIVTGEAENEEVDVLELDLETTTRMKMEETTIGAEVRTGTGTTASSSCSSSSSSCSTSCTSTSKITSGSGCGAGGDSVSGDVGVGVGTGSSSSSPSTSPTILTTAVSSSTSSSTSSSVSKPTTSSQLLRNGTTTAQRRKGSLSRSPGNSTKSMLRSPNGARPSTSRESCHSHLKTKEGNNKRSSVTRGSRNSRGSTSNNATGSSCTTARPGSGGPEQVTCPLVVTSTLNSSTACGGRDSNRYTKKTNTFSSSTSSTSSNVGRNSLTNNRANTASAGRTSSSRENPPAASAATSKMRQSPDTPGSAGLMRSFDSRATGSSSSPYTEEESGRPQNAGGGSYSSSAITAASGAIHQPGETGTRESGSSDTFVHGEAPDLEAGGGPSLFPELGEPTTTNGCSLRLVDHDDGLLSPRSAAELLGLGSISLGQEDEASFR
ncbi:unnamed protein product [Amoebophrya sp. A25]|nr:unnamed protein product [Amoebophrya sp. A25]|eukprot:GSA25T00022254001.1